MYSSQYWYLQNHSLFKHLNNSDLNEICYIAAYKTVRKGDIIFFSEENNGRVFTLKKGSLKIVKIDVEGNEIVKDILKVGDLFGSLDLIESNEDEYAIVLSDTATFCSFKTADFEKFIENKPEVAVKYTKWIGFWFKRLENRYSNIMFKDVKTRLLNFLKDIAKDHQTDPDGYVSLPNYLTHQDIASLICSTRQTVTSLLNTLKSEGIITYSRKEIKVKISVL
ncbi:Crp/Fnr family transcriptional regulator [Lacihabitans sp. CS3-21]|uniref:Crp/Fnr family transcriptional regulator n=1 Tax=Lacihabitans sp. CS3-21 TaxID=2487332 RepID=UPI0020CF89B8|nr:Crp/Fnr family transcriptional regulator [Lacihabitans sp. CS3-21]